MGWYWYTQCSAAAAMMCPIATLTSGPDEGRRAAVPCEDTDTLVVCDIGGTISDVGLVQGGFVQLSAAKCRLTGIDQLRGAARARGGGGPTPRA